MFTIKSDLDPIGTLTKASIAEAHKENEAQNQKNREMILDFYEGRGGNKQYLETYGYESREVNLPFPFTRLTHNIINRTSMVYKRPPDRPIIIGEKENPVYDEFLAKHMNLSRGFKTSERYKNALHSVLFRPMYYNRRWNSWIETEWTPHFKNGDALVPFAYSIPVKRDTTITDARQIEDKELWMFWSDEYYYWHDIDGNIQFDPNYPDGKNPFGRIPFIEKRKEDAVSGYWPEGEMELVRGNQAINITWCDLIYSQHTQAFTQPYIIGITPEQAKTLRTAQDSLWGIGQPEPGIAVGTIDFNPKIMEMLTSLKTQIELVSASYNLSVKWAQDGNPASGFSLLVQNIDLMESREDDVERAEWEEGEIYDIIQIQDEVLGLGNKLPKREKETKLMVDFHEMSFPINQADEIERLEFEYANNISTPVDTIQSKEGLDEIEALVRYNRNKALNQKLSLREQMLRDELQGAIVEPEADSPE